MWEQSAYLMRGYGASHGTKRQLLQLNFPHPGGKSQTAVHHGAYNIAPGSFTESWEDFERILGHLTADFRISRMVYSNVKTSMFRGISTTFCEMP